MASTSPLATRFGGGQLDAEDANNLSFGFTASIGGLDLTVDYYDIDIENRFSQISADLTAADQLALVNQGVPEAATVSRVQFFVNDFDTNTSGIEIVASYPLEWANSQTDVTFAFNSTDNDVTNRGQTITDGRAREIQDSVPDTRFTLAFNHQWQDLNGLLRNNYYDDAYESLLNDDTLPVVTDALFIVDAELQWQVNDAYSIALGAKNLFDEFPDEWETQGFTGRDGGFLGAIYPLNHPAGLGGGSYYLRVKADF